MTRLPPFAERHFAAMVSEYDGLCHGVEEDESGWDYLVELPAREYDGAADSQPPRQRAFVQVKSIQGAKASVPITLSNLLKSAQDPNPWFIVLIKKRQGTPVLYIKHFWKHLIASSLIAIRKAEVEGAKLNKRTMSVSFSEDDIVTHDFIRWMQDRIDESDDYLVEKRSFYTNVGHENGYGTGRMLFTDHTTDEIFKEFLGMGNGLRISSFEYVPERFSLPDYSRKISETGGTVHITAQPQGTCEVRFRSSPIDPAFSMTGTMYSVPFAPDAPIRVSAPPVELLFSPKRVSLDMAMRFGEPLPLDHWHAYSRLKLWSMKGPLQVELWRNGRKHDASILIDRQTGQNLDWDKLYGLSETIRAIAADRKVTDLSFSLPDINAHISDLGYLFQSRAPSVRFECEAHAPLKLGVTSFLHYSLADLAGWTFGHLIRRTVLKDVIDGDRRIITAGPFKILETYAFRDAGPEERALVQDDYMRVLTALEKTEHPLGFGEFGTYVRQLHSLPEIPTETS
ncbi:hypothetical protein [Devosia alba]|uniref:hypothetical protein n=1 Tax=Devosia alba TaxID=3152360 RepID=UPI003266FEF2